MSLFYQDIDNWHISPRTEEQIELGSALGFTFALIHGAMETTINKIKQLPVQKQNNILARALNRNNKLKLSDVTSSDEVILIHFVEFAGTVIERNIAYDDDYTELIEQIKDFSSELGTVKIFAPEYPGYTILPACTSIQF